MVSANDDTTGFMAIVPPWMRKLMSGNMKFWQMTDAEIEFYLEGRRETQRLAQERQEQLENERAAMYGADDVEARASSEQHDEKHSSTGSPSFDPVNVSHLPNSNAHNEQEEPRHVAISNTQ